MKNNLKTTLLQKQPVVLWDYEVEFDNGVRLSYKEWTDPKDGSVLNYALSNLDGDTITDDRLIELIQIEIEKSLL